jgi:hypothetical protein
MTTAITLEPRASTGWASGAFQVVTKLVVAHDRSSEQIKPEHHSPAGTRERRADGANNCCNDIMHDLVDEPEWYHFRAVAGSLFQARS